MALPRAGKSKLGGRMKLRIQATHGRGFIGKGEDSPESIAQGLVNGRGDKAIAAGMSTRASRRTSFLATRSGER